MNTQSVTLDISKERTDMDIVRIGQGDSSGTTIGATVLDNGQPASIAGYTAKMHMRLPDGKSYAEGGSCSVSGNVITCIVDEERFAAVAGYTDEAYFSLTSGTTVYSTSRFRVKVERAASKGADPASSYSDDSVSATTAAREAANAATAAMEEIGSAVEDAAEAAESAAQAVTDAQMAIDDADAAKREATTAANTANAAANNANSKANAANTAANNANAATTATNSATQRAEAAISAMGDISEQAVPLMSADVRGGSKLAPKGGLTLDDELLRIGSLAQSGDGTDAGPIAELTAKGWAEQDSTTGKNLLPNNATSQTINGVTFTVNADGSIRVTGTATAAANLDIGRGITTLPAGTYTANGVIGSGCLFTLFKIVDGNVGGIASNFTTTTFTITEETSVFLRAAVSSGTTPNATVYPMLRLASITDDTYEPYTGGAPSPSPEFPQTIEVVRGRNLLDDSKPVSKVDGTTVSGDLKNGITITNSTTATTARIAAMPVEIGKQYTLSFDAVSSIASANVNVDIGDQNASGTAAGYTAVAVSNVKSRKTITLTYGTATQHKHLDFTVTSQATVTITNVQLTLGSTPQPYVPYGHVGMEAQGRNLLDVENASFDFYPQSSSGSGAKSGTSVIVTAIAVQAGGETGVLCRFKDIKELINDAQYTISFDAVSNTANAKLRCDIGDRNLYRTEFYIGTTRQRYSYTSLAGTQKWIDFELCTVASVTISNIQLELGSTAHEYKPYYHSTTPIPLPQRGWVASLPDGTADTLTLDGAGKCVWELADEEVVLDGSESWQAPNPNSTNTYFISSFGAVSLNVLVGVPKYPAYHAFISSFANARAILSSQDLSVGDSWLGHSGYSATNLLVLKPNDSIATVADFKTWLASNPVTVLYPLATPVTEDMGYIEDWPDIPAGATLQIPELSDVGVKFFVDDSVTVLAQQWYARAYTELGDAIVDLAQRVSDLEG